MNVKLAMELLEFLEAMLQKLLPCGFEEDRQCQEDS
jgi:hypothetical protein